jgi:uncharacterized protein
MFGFTKILVLGAIVIAVWYGFKFIGRLDQRRKRELADARRTKADAAEDVGEMVKCRTCGVFVAARGAGNCGRGDCPY